MSDTIAILAVLPRYPWYYHGNGYRLLYYHGMEVEICGNPAGWGPGLQYYRGYGVGFSCLCV